MNHRIIKALQTLASKGSNHSVLHDSVIHCITSKGSNHSVHLRFDVEADFSTSPCEFAHIEPLVKKPSELVMDIEGDASNALINLVKTLLVENANRYRGLNRHRFNTYSQNH